MNFTHLNNQIIKLAAKTTIPVKSFSDKELLILIGQDNIAAFDELYERYWKYLFTIAAGKLNSAEEIKDTLQDLFLYIWAKRKELQLTGSVKAYLFTALRNRIINFYKHRVVQEKALSYLAVHSVDRATGQHQVTVKELQDIVQHEVGLLPPRMREVFLLRKEEDLSVSEIAGRLSISVQTAKNQLGMALQRLRSKVNPYLEDHPDL